VYRWDFIFASLFVLLISRACNIFPLSFLTNLFARPGNKIPRNHQIMMWWSGTAAPLRPRSG